MSGTVLRPPVLPAVYDTTRWSGRVLSVLDHVTMVLLLVSVTTMVGVVSVQVLLRYGFNMSLDWSEEISRLAFVWSIFLAIPLGVRQGSHIGIDVVINQFPQAMQKTLRRVAAALSAAMMLAIAWAALGVAREQWDELMTSLDWSVGWFIVPVGLSALLSGLHLIRITIEGPPLAVPGAAE